MRPWWQRDWFFGLLLMVLTALAYQPAWNGQPIWDDDMHLTRVELRSLAGLGRIWTQPGTTPQYYPLVHSVFWIEHRLWGDLPLGYHLVNILLHGLSALLLLRILRHLKVPGARLTAILFALHPVQVESVAWISELKNTLSGVLFFAAAWTYLYFTSRQPRSWTLYISALGLFVLALLSKTVTAVLPAVLLLVLWWKRGRPPGRAELLPLLPFFVLGALSGISTARIEQNFVGARGPEFEFSLIERTLIAGRAIWFYLGKLAWPDNLIFNYPRWQINQSLWWQYLFPLAALILLIALWLKRRSHPSLLTTLLLFTGTLVPVLGFLNVYPFRYSFVADHFQYLACVAPLTLLAAGISTGFSRLKNSAARVMYPLCAALMVAALGTLTWSQAGMYSDMETLWRKTIARNPRSAMAYNNLGLLLFQEGQLQEATLYFQVAVELQPDNPEAHNNLGNAFRQGRGVEQAIVHFRKAVEIRPDFAIYQANLGSALVELGRPGEGVAHYQTALAIAPNDPVLANNLAWILATSPENSVRDGAKAVELAKQAVGSSGGKDPRTTGTLAAAYAEAGRFEEAVATGEKARGLALAAGKPELVELNTRLVQFYRAGRPYHGEP